MRVNSDSEEMIRASPTPGLRNSYDYGCNGGRRSMKQANYAWTIQAADGDPADFNQLSSC